MTVHLYGPDGYFKFKDSYKKEGKLEVEKIRGGVLWAKDVNADNLVFSKQFYEKGYVLDEQRRWVLTSGANAAEIGARSAETIELPQEPEIRHKKALFLGGGLNLWGHILIEWLARVWALPDNEEYQNCDLCYIVRGQEQSYIFQIFDYLGIDKKRLVRVDAPVKYDEVAVPQVSSRLDRFWTDEYKQTIERIKQRIKPVNGGKYYLSRMRFADAVLGESCLENIFRNNGYQVVYPEQLSVEEQLAIYSGADELACVCGTTAHNMMFAKDGAKCTILERMPYPNRTQPVINDMVGADYSVVMANKDFLPTHTYSGPFLMAVTPWVERYFQENGVKYTQEDAKAWQKYLYAYVKIWHALHRKEKNIRIALRTNSGFTYEQITALWQKVDRALKKAPNKWCCDKNALRCARELFSDDFCRIDLHMRSGVDSFSARVSGEDELLAPVGWMMKYGLFGYSVERQEKSFELEIDVQRDGKLEIGLKGLWKLKDENNREAGLVEYWVDYTKLAINGKDVLAEKTPAWHNQPFNYAVEVKRGEKLKIAVVWEKHLTTEEKLAETTKALDTAEMRLSEKAKVLAMVEKSQNVLEQRVAEEQKANQVLADKVRFLTEQLNGLAYRQGYHKPVRVSKGNFWYRRVETEAYVKTYICGIRTRKRPANPCKFIDARLAEMEQRLKAYIAKCGGE